MVWRKNFLTLPGILGSSHCKLNPTLVLYYGWLCTSYIVTILWVGPMFILNMIIEVVMLQDVGLVWWKWGCLSSWLSCSKPKHNQKLLKLFGSLNKGVRKLTKISEGTYLSSPSRMRKKKYQCLSYKNLNKHAQMDCGYNCFSWRLY